MKKILIIAALLFVALNLLPAIGFGQSKEEAMRLYNEADKLDENPQSKDDLVKAVQKYELAMRMFEGLGDKKRVGVCANNAGLIYEKWGQYDKAVEYYQRSLASDRELRDRKGEGRSLKNLGDAFKSSGKYDKAKEYYEKSLAIKRELKDRKGEGISLRNLGDVYRARDQYDKALEFYEKSLAVYRELKDRKGEAKSLGCLGLLFSAWNQYDKAVEFYEKSLQITRDVKDRQTEGQTLYNLGGAYKDWGEYDKALGYYEKSLGVAREFKDRRSEADILGNLGVVYWNLGQYDKAIEYNEKSLVIDRELNNRKGEAYSLGNLGTVFYDRGQSDKAVEYYEKALTVCREINDRKGEGKCLNNLGSVCFDYGRYDMAVDHFEKSLAIRREVKDRDGEGKSLNNLGNVFWQWGQYAQAVDYYEKSLAICRELKDRKGEGSALNNLGNVYTDWGQFDKAMEYYEKDVAICRGLKDSKGEGHAVLNLGQVLQHRGEPKKALEHFQKGLSIYTEIKVPTHWPKALIADTYMDSGDLAKAEPLLKEANYNNRWGRFYLLKADWAKAKEYYGKILKSAEENRNAENLFTAYTGLGFACEGLKEDTAAAEHYEKAVKFTEEIRSSLSAAEREKFFDVTIKGFTRTAPYEGLARVQMRLNKPQEAFKTTEYTKARVFAEAMSRMSQGKNLAVPPEIVKQDTSLNNELVSLKKNLQKAFEKNNKLVIESLEPQIKEKEGKLQAHIRMLREKYPLFAATKYPQPMDLSQTVLKDNEWVLSYDVTDPGILIYLTKGKTLEKAMFKPIPRKEVDDLVRKFREPLELKEGKKISDQLKKFDFSSGKKLADILLSDILPVLPKDTPVIVVPGGSLGIVPFEMLVLNEGGKITTEKERPAVTGTEFFGDRNPISYYQSVTALTLARTLGKQKGPGQKVLVMDDPVFGSDDPRVKQAAQSKKQTALASLPDKLMSMKKEIGLAFPRLPLTGELGQSLKKLEPNKTDEFTGIQANKSVLFDKPLNQYNSMIFATHGYFGKDLPGIMEPVLVLTLPGQPEGKDGFLRLSEVMGLNLNADIVALTACQTGLGRHISGEGTMGMGRAFQYAGAKSVLMSLWSVSEAGSVKLVESFFKNIKEGKNKLEALRLARKEIREQGYDHPFYWAPFILVGEVR